MRCSTLRGTFCLLITLATPRQDWTGSNPSRREGGGCGFTLSRPHSCCAVRLVYIQISPGHIWTTLYFNIFLKIILKNPMRSFNIFCPYQKSKTNTVLFLPIYGQRVWLRTVCSLHEQFCNNTWPYRFNLYDRAPMRTLPPDQIPQLYEDIHLLAATVKDPQGEWWLKLHPGTVLFVDNWRVLHGRASYTGLRKMTGCYVSRSDYISKARVLGII